MRIEVVAYDHPDAAGLVAEVQQEYQVRYGGPDATAVDRAEFAPPAGLARAMLAELERTALAAGHRRMILETGRAQPEAVALYQSAGYTPIAAFGHHVGAPLSIHLGKLLVHD